MWTVLLWRVLLAAGFMSAYLAWRRGPAGLADWKRLGWAGWSAATAGSAATVCFIAAFKHTAVANVAIVYATAPFAAAAVAWVWMREAPGLATLVSAGLCLAGVIVMMGGSAGSPDLVGDLLAVGMTVLMASMMVTMRRWPDRPMTLAVGPVSCLQIAGPRGTPLAPPPLHDTLARRRRWMNTSRFLAGAADIESRTRRNERGMARVDRRAGEPAPARLRAGGPCAGIPRRDGYPLGIEHCEPASSTGPVTETDTPPDPETPSPPEPETPAPPDPETPEPETPTEPETTEPTAPEFAVALTGAVRGSAGKVAVSGAMTNAGTTGSAPIRIRSLIGRRHVHTATVPAIDGGGVHAINADVTMPEGSAVQVCLVPKGRDADPSNGLRRASP